MPFTGKLISSAILVLPRKEVQYTLDIDACNCRIWCVLLQSQADYVDEPTEFWSKILNDREQNLSTTHRVHNTVIWGNLASTSVHRGYYLRCSNRPSCPEINPEVSRGHMQTCRILSSLYVVPLRHIPSGLSNTRQMTHYGDFPGRVRIIRT